MGSSREPRAVEERVNIDKIDEAARQVNVSHRPAAAPNGESEDPWKEFVLSRE